jgi:diaminohydroxyphosphoribosylaminopyrimidine deaminase/5-amino-6-(5-phosphoribosylamino)uracil reductase
LPGNEWKKPTRIAIDRRGKTPLEHNLFDGTSPTIIFRETGDFTSLNVEFINTPFDASLPETILFQLYQRNIQSVMIEGGAKLLRSFIEKGLWDEARIFKTDVFFGSGINAPVLHSKSFTQSSIENDKLNVYKFSY